MRHEVCRMIVRGRHIALWLCLSGVACQASRPPAAAPASEHLHVEPLGRGVYAVLRDDPIGFAQNANSMVVIGDRDVIVVDAQFTRDATLETIAAIRRLTSKPVAWVVNTHWHDDHVAGDQVYRDSFPDVRFVMHANTAADLVRLGRPNRAGQVEGAPPAADRFERLLGQGLGGDSTPVSPDERRSLSAAIRIIRQYVAEAPGFREMAATDTVRTALRLGRGETAVDIRWFGCGNTRGDLVVSVPRQGIVATGDLVVWPVPFGFGAYPAAWVQALDSVLARHPRVMVPGHGPVLRDTTYVRSLRDMLAQIVRVTGDASARGDSLRAAARALPLDREREAVPLDPKWREFLFQSFFRRPVLARAWERPACD